MGDQQWVIDPDALRARTRLLTIHRPDGTTVYYRVLREPLFQHIDPPETPAPEEPR
jgi:hypothetical protein